jgi:hypothetical protein
VDGYVFPEKLAESSPDEMKKPSPIQGDQKKCYELWHLGIYVYHHAILGWGENKKCRHLSLCPALIGQVETNVLLAGSLGEDAGVGLSVIVQQISIISF